ncbi:hypothetical protein [Streptomyces sp. ME19-01-6]|uniref:hypothetical protein n=1 Tax=Streptomyces sp. ME19-01-6 TaxID=3028686 RepID=UPI0029B86085|nr:hypothetical protein [Streptomyces sp. ME19-01-6]MDX3231094.1 hypothetical protein [Streptomyces sp. ME19-01-6]
MTDTTPYDNDRNELSRPALARLVLSDRAVALAETAGTLAVTRYDAYTGPGGRASEALTLTRIADRLLAYAVVYERERGSSWEEIAQYLGMDAATAEERFTPEIERWNTAFAVPYRLDETGRKRIPNLPTAAYDPRSACRRLDLWTHVHLTIDDKHAVSDGLRPSFLQDEQDEPSDIDGWIWRRNFASFMESLSRYLDTDWDETDWDTVALRLEGTDDSGPDNGWYTHPLTGAWQSVEVRLANIAGGDRLSVVVAGAEYSELRLRIDTLLSAFAVEP